MMFLFLLTICGTLCHFVHAEETNSTQNTPSNHSPDELFDDVTDIWYWNDFEPSPIDNPTTIVREDLIEHKETATSQDIQKLDAAILLLKKRIETYRTMEQFFDEESKKLELDDFLPDYSDSEMSLKFYEWTTIAEHQLHQLEEKRRRMLKNQEQPSP